MYDYIVIGAGSSGCIVASKLAASNASIKILLIEAGGFPFAKQMYLVSDWYEVLKRYPEIAWEGYKSSPQPGLHNRVITPDIPHFQLAHSGIKFETFSRQGFDRNLVQTNYFLVILNRFSLLRIKHLLGCCDLLASSLMF